MNRKAVWAIVRKDVQAVTANLQVWLPMLIIPLIMGLVLPAVFVIAFSQVNVGSMGQADQILSMLNRMPEGSLRSALNALPSVNHQLIFFTANYILAPFFLLIPLMTASVIAADSFAGEKERSTLETLLFAPVDTLSLLIGKVLAAFLPAILLSWGTFLLTTITVNLAGFPLFHRLFFPQWNWLPLMLLVIPMLSLATVFLLVFISARTATFQAAYQMSAVVVIPFLVLVVGQVTGLLVMGTLVLSIIGVVLALVNWGLARIILKRLNRAQLFESQVN